MAPRTGARSIRLVLSPASRGYYGMLSARVHRDGRVADRILSRLSTYHDVTTDDVHGIISALEHAVAELRRQHPRDPSPQGPESPEGTTGGPLPQDRYAPEDPPLPGT